MTAPGAAKEPAGHVLTCCYCHRSDRALKPHPDQPGMLVCINVTPCLKDMRARIFADPIERGVLDREPPW